jgi:hypothetical protein
MIGRFRIRDVASAVVALIAGAALVLAAVAYNDSRQDAEELREALIVNCEVVTEPLRLAGIAAIGVLVAPGDGNRPPLHKDWGWRQGTRTDLLRIRARLAATEPCEDRLPLPRKDEP